VYAIEAHNLGKVYDNGVIGITELELAVDQGTIFGFLGPNGAGKTTTVRLLNGTLTPTAGSSTVLGTVSQDEEVRRVTATLAESALMYENMTVLDNLRFFAAMYDMQPREADRRIEELLRRLGLWEKRNLKLGSFSTGMKKRVYLARTLLHRPKIIFLDEPTSGLDPDASLQVTRLIERLARETGTTILLCTHNLPLAEDICDVFGFIRDGKMVACGKREEMIRSIMDTQRVRIRTLENTHDLEYEREQEINALVRRVMDDGEHIVDVRILRPTLQEVYFHYIGRREDELA
jgi:ABC-2 type transport system ATP-binding protein